MLGEQILHNLLHFFLSHCRTMMHMKVWKHIFSLLHQHPNVVQIVQHGLTKCHYWNWSFYNENWIRMNTIWNSPFEIANGFYWAKLFTFTTNKNITNSGLCDSDAGNYIHFFILKMKLDKTMAGQQLKCHFCDPIDHWTKSHFFFCNLHNNKNTYFVLTMWLMRHWWSWNKNMKLKFCWSPRESAKYRKTSSKIKTWNKKIPS